MRQWRWWSVAALLTCCCAWAQPGPEEQGVVEVTVTRADGTAVRETPVRVTVGGYVEVTFTDAEGRYVLGRWPLSEYGLAVEAGERGTGEARLALEEGAGAAEARVELRGEGDAGT